METVWSFPALTYRIPCPVAARPDLEEPSTPLRFDSLRNTAGIFAARGLDGAPDSGSSDTGYDP
ncbi:hypothetical protein CDV50_15555 [Haematobacter massiliensis]|uniref:Uncharacterized protein n=1 Tax=Haematobacter massiliensis TaxID=195105 RepID=A0A086Y598_9RHOB|nr:hypothetical protein [Haematobacter massiliensis]KFI29448.1 hypothetical protein CN97_16760 [Haematobacter massiliensis]OWJ69876.1 hypothetical protein CDV50_15555 [Haematobacter massiliensis]OWJ83676.1 hypothetical protein CDV51_15555 [Haematobacter massiliensis]